CRANRRWVRCLGRRQRHATPAGRWPGSDVAQPPDGRVWTVRTRGCRARPGSLPRECRDGGRRWGGGQRSCAWPFAIGSGRRAAPAGHFGRPRGGGWSSPGVEGDRGDGGAVAPGVQQPGGGTELGGPAVREPVVVEDDVPVVERVGGAVAVAE